MSRFNCLVFGLGQVGRMVCKTLLDEGVAIAGLYSRASHVGEDLGEVLGQSKAGIVVRSAGEFRARAGEADIALFFTTSYLDDLLGEARQCLEQGINVLTIAEDALYPWHHSPELARQLDEAARRGGATLLGTGVNDVAMAQLPAVLGAFTTGVRRIEVECTGNFGRFGAKTLEGMPLGLDQAGYDAWLAAAASAEGPQQASITGQSLEALLAMTGLQAAAPLDIELQPAWTSSTLVVPALDMQIAAGSTSGIVEIARVSTRQGVEIEMRLVGKVFESHDEEYLQVDITASHSMSLRVSPMPGVEVTSALVVSRIADVLAAEPGLQSCDRLPCARLRVFQPAV